MPVVENAGFYGLTVNNRDNAAYFAGMNVVSVLEEMALVLPADKREQLKKELAAYLNALLLHDFPALVQLLYRVDVSEKKLEAVLKDHPQTDAGDLLADLLIERHLGKAAAKKQFHFRTDASEEERW